MCRVLGGTVYKLGVGGDGVCVGCWRGQCMSWGLEGTGYELGVGESRGQLRCPLKSSYLSSPEQEHSSS